MRTFVAAVLLAAAPVLAASPVLEDVRVLPGPRPTISVRLSAPVEFRARALPSDGETPHRLYLDLAGTALGAAAPRVRDGAGPLLRVRTGQFDPETTRVVLDLSGEMPFEVRAEGSTVTVTLSPPTVALKPESMAPAAEQPPVAKAEAKVATPEPAPVETVEPKVAAPDLPPTAKAEPTTAADKPPSVTNAEGKPAPPEAPAERKAAVSEPPSPPAPSSPPAGAIVPRPMPLTPQDVIVMHGPPLSPAEDAIATMSPDPAPAEATAPPSPEQTAEATPSPSSPAQTAENEHAPPPAPATAPELPGPTRPPTASSAAPAKPAPARKRPPKIASALPPTPLIVLDAGHGGRDPGAEGVGGVIEKDVVLELAHALAKRMVERLRVNVFLTRSDDSYLNIDRRLAVPSDAMLFLSLHANSCPDPSARGLEIFYGGGAVRPADTDGASPRAELLGRCLDEALSARVGGVRGSARLGSFSILARNPLPSALIEIGYLTHPDEAALTQDAAYRLLMADALIDGLEAFLRASAPPL